MRMSEQGCASGPVGVAALGARVASPRRAAAARPGTAARTGRRAAGGDRRRGRPRGGAGTRLRRGHARPPASGSRRSSACSPRWPTTPVVTSSGSPTRCWISRWSSRDRWSARRWPRSASSCCRSCATALSQLPQATRHIELHLDPADVALVRSVLPADHPGPPVTIVADASVGPGGCIVDTEQASVDATVASRWRRLLAGLGRTDDWLERA